VQSAVSAPKRLRIEKRGNYVAMSIASAGEELHPAGGAARVDFTGDFYIGLGVSAHNTARIETATFSDVVLGTPAPVTGRTTLVNTLETISLRSRDRRVAYVVTQPGRIEAPNWFPDATNTLYFNTGGKLFKVQADLPGTPANPNRQTVPQPVDLGILTRINNDHGVTNDGTLWAISDQSQTVNGSRASLIYTVPVAGVPAKRMGRRSPTVPSGTATSTSTRWRSTAATRSASRRRKEKTTDRNIRRTGSTSTSIPNAAARCRSGA
jgi:hypothetical protein